MGGLAGVAVYFGVHRTPRAERWATFDVVAFAFAPALAVGRIGCALVHDHPGHAMDVPVAVSLQTETAAQFITSVYRGAGLADRLPPPAELAGLGFHDLGLYELGILALVVVPVLVWLGRAPRPPGFFVGAFVALYMPVRFGLDALRVLDVQYAGLTPAQWAALPVVWRSARQVPTLAVRPTAP